MITRLYTANVRKCCLSSLAVLSLSGCGYFSDDWEMVDGRCQAVSSDGERVAIVTSDIVAFMDMAKSCRRISVIWIVTQLILMSMVSCIPRRYKSVIRIPGCTIWFWWGRR